MPAVEPGMAPYDWCSRGPGRSDARFRPSQSSVTSPASTFSGSTPSPRVSREMDVRERNLQAQGKAWFSIAGAGREILGWAFARHLRHYGPEMPLLPRPDSGAGLGSESRGDVPRNRRRGNRSGLRRAPDAESLGRQALRRGEPNQPDRARRPSPRSAWPRACSGLRRLGVEIAEPWREDPSSTSPSEREPRPQGEIEEAVRQSVRAKAPIIFVDRRRYVRHLHSRHAGRYPAATSTAYTGTTRTSACWSLSCDGTDVEDADDCAARAVAYARARSGPAWSMPA